MRRRVVIEPCQLLEGFCCPYDAGSTFFVNASTLYRNWEWNFSEGYNFELPSALVLSQGETFDKKRSSN